MKKKLLSEAQVRRFMGLAGINPLNEMAYKHDDEHNEGMREAELDEKMRGKEDPNLMEEEEEVEMEKEDDQDGEVDLEMDEEVIKRIKTNLEELQDDLAPLIAQGEEALEDEEGLEEPGEEPDLDMGDDMAMDDEEEDMDDELMEVEMELSEEEIVNEVARRVAKRIVEAKRAQKRMNEALGRKR